MSFFKTGKTNGSQNKEGSVLLSTTVRDYSGGLNVADTDLNMKPKYAKTLDNLERALDGSLSIRPGTVLFATCAASADVSAVVNMVYFNTFIITVQTSGRVCKVDGAGVVTSLSTAWGATTFVSFTIFNSQLILCNGANKPLLIEGNPNKANYMICVALIDLGSVSNVNTPVGSLVISHAQYTIIAGITAAPSTVYISARGTSGTYLGDPAPNDAVAIDLGPRVSLGSSAITGLVSYRDKLMVTFERGVLPINLGIYTGSPAVHTPTDDGFIEEYGCLAHRSLISVGDDTYFNDNIGVNSIERIVLYNTLRPERVSQLVDPLITALIQPLTPAQIAQYVFAVYDMRNKRYMLFVPVFVSGVLTETIGFSYTDIPTLKIAAWARLRGWTWSCACRTLLQNIVFASGNKLYNYDFANLDTRNADFVGDTARNTDGTGLPITFDWELPWADFNKRMNIKETAYISFDTTGSGAFTASMYVDNIRFGLNGVDAIPALSTDFIAGPLSGYGLQKFGDSPYGGGRATADERLMAWPCKFKINKLRMQGSTKLPIKFVSISLAYKRGSIRR